MKKKTGWKLLKKYGKHYCSISSELRKVYKMGKIVPRRKGCGPMAVFESYHFAILFVRRHELYNEKHYIVRCTYGESKDHCLYYPVRLLGKQATKSNPYAHERCTSGGDCPLGANFADWIYFDKYPTLLTKEIN